MIIDNACPLCGGCIEVVVADEGTAHYQRVLRDREGLRDDLLQEPFYLAVDEADAILEAIEKHL
jgi:hypothetical protein